MIGKTIACIGESMVEVAMLPGNQYKAQIGFGGDTLNTAIYLSRLWAKSEHQASYVTLLGDDPNGAAMLQAWQEEAVECTHVEQIKQRETGLYMINIDDQGERAFRYWRALAPVRELFEGSEGLKRLNRLADVDGIFFSGITLAVLYPQSRERLLGFAKELKQAGRLVAYDTNHRARLWSAEEAHQLNKQALAACNLALPSEEDLSGIFVKPSDGWQVLLEAFSIAEIVLKRGGQPLQIYHQAAWFELTLSMLSKVVDTTAAGDSFNAGYLAGRLQNATPHQAALMAHELAATVISHPGAIIPKTMMPTE